MAVGRREEWRQMLLAHGWVIGQLFEDHSAGEAQIEQFIRTGNPGDASEAKEPHNPAVDEKVAEILRNGGKVIVR